MERQDVPAWVLALEQEHLEFIRKFVLNSGSLKRHGDFLSSIVSDRSDEVEPID